MFKKVLIATLAVVFGLAVIKGTWFGSMMCSKIRHASEWAKRQVKPEDEMQRLRDEIDRLEKGDAVFFHQVAKQRLEVKKLSDQLEKDKAQLASLSTRIRELRSALAKEGDVQTISFRGASYSKSDAESQVEIDFNRYKPLKRAVESQEKYLASSRETLSQNEEKLSDLRRTRVEMLTKLKNLRIKLNEIRQAQKAGSSLIDDSAYSRVQQGIDDLSQRLSEEEETLKVQGLTGRGPIEQAEEVRAKKAQRDKDLNAEFPVEGGAIVNK